MLSPIIYSDRVSQPFTARLREVAESLRCDPNHLMACIAFESAHTFDPAVRNARSGAVGLIQFMPQTAARLGTSPEHLAQMTATDQLSYVEKYFLPYRGQLRRLEDLYMAILWPRAVGKPLKYVLFTRNDGMVFRQNSGLDKSKDGIITKAEAASCVRRILAAGMARLEGEK